MDGLTEGRIVHYSVTGEQCRAAIVVRVWGPTTTNLHVFLDGENDSKLADPINGSALALHPWVTSRLEGTEPGTWHDPRKCLNRV